MKGGGGGDGRREGGAGEDIGLLYRVREDLSMTDAKVKGGYRVNFAKQVR